MSTLNKVALFLNYFSLGLNSAYCVVFLLAGAYVPAILSAIMAAVSYAVIQLLKRNE